MSDTAPYVAVDAVRAILLHVGEDPDREGLVETPRRYVRFLEEFLSPPEPTMTTFVNEGSETDMIVQTGVRFTSLCEHHLAPFVGVGAIAYIPAKRILGLSKLARVLEYYSRRLQNQERITAQVAAAIEEATGAHGVAVYLRAEHMCMTVRGVRKHGAETTTTTFTGRFRDYHDLRNQFLAEVQAGRVR